MMPLVALAAIATLLPHTAGADDKPLSPLTIFSQSVEALVQQVSPSVVQVLTTGYGPMDDSRDSTESFVGRQRSLGSGVIIDAGGYIITNAHVIAGARRIQVVLPAHVLNDTPARSMVSGRGEVVDATLIGVAGEIDLALLKVERQGLTALPIANYDALRQGEMVFAFGSPDGMRDSVTMGVVSAVARQSHPDDPLVYVQTDAPINPGNSGGPLVNAQGELVGVNTFIMSESGGNEGLGFAIPGALVEMAYPRLQKYGYLHRGEMGLSFQTVTPTLAAGLNLPVDTGVIVSDVVPGGPADAADLEVQDIVISADDRPVDSLPLLAFHLFTRSPGDHITLKLRRGTETLTRTVTVVEPARGVDQMSDLLDPVTSRVGPLGILGIELSDERLAGRFASRREASGVLVAARTPQPPSVDITLMSGDVIHAVNGTRVGTLAALRAILGILPPHGPLVLQVERDGELTYLSAQLD
jgi:serine protease Do